MSIGTTGAIIGGSVIGAGASLVGSAIGANSASAAADAQLKFQREGLDYQKQQSERAYNFMTDEQKRFEPFRESQLRAISQLEGLADPNNPYAASERKISTDAIQRTLAAQGLLRSSAQGTELQNLELGLAQRRQNILQALAGTGAGAQAASMGQNIGQSLLNSGSQIGSQFGQMGQTVGAGLMGQGQAWQQGVGQINNAFQGGVSNFMQLELLNRFGNNGAGGSGGGGGTYNPVALPNLANVGSYRPGQSFSPVQLKTYGFNK